MKQVLSDASRSDTAADRVRALHRFAGTLGLLVVALSLVAIAGWILGVEALIRPFGGTATMKFATAVGLVIVGGCVADLGLTKQSPRPSTVLVPLGLTLAYFVAVIAEYLTNSSFGIDNPFGLDTITASSGYPGRPAPLSALAVAMLCVSVIAHVMGRPRAAQLVAILTFVIGHTALIGYVFHVSSLYTVGSYATMARPAAIAILLSTAAIILLSAESGLVALLAGDTSTGLVMRRLVPLILLAPSLVGGVLVAGSRDGWFDQRFALAIFVALLTALGVATVYAVASELRTSESHRRGAEEALQETRTTLAERDAYAQKLESSESRLRAMIQNSVDAYIQLDKDGRVALWNPMAEEIFGFDAEAAVGRVLSDLVIPEEYVDAHGRGFERYLATGEPVVLGKVLHLDGLHQDGRRVALELVIWATRDHNDEPVFHSFLRDDTPRRTAEADLRRSNDLLEEFAAAVAHDLRSPIAAIQGMAELIEMDVHEADGPPDLRQVADFAGRIVVASQRSADLIADLLDYATLSGATAELRSLDLADLIDDVVQAQQSSSTRPFTTDVSPLPEVLGDATLLRQLFSNLFANAAKYVPADRELSLGVSSRKAQVAGRVVICVSDNGDGIPDADKESIFDAFHRREVDLATPGTGLGLALCRRAVDRHEGRLWVEDTAGGGASFCFDLPVRAKRHAT